MRNFPPTFKAELSRPGCTPYWLLKLVTTSGTYYLSDNDRYIAALSAQAYGVVKSFGAIREGVAAALSDFQVAEYSVDLLLGVPVSGGGMTIDTLAADGYLDDCQADLYLGLAGITDAPQLICPGRVRDFGTMTDTSLPILIQDKTVLLERTYIGKKVSNTDYPQASAADVGKFIPIPFGAVPKVPALVLDCGVQTALSAACTASATTLYVTNVARIFAGATFLIETEQVYVNSVGTYTISVTRGYNSTVAKAHNQGASAVQLKTLAFCVSWRALTAIPKVWLRHNDIDHDITSYTTCYTGQSGNQLAGYASMGMVTISPAGMVSIAGLLQVGVVDTIATDAQHQYCQVDLDTYTSSGIIDYLPSIINGNLMDGSKMWLNSSVTLKKVKLVSGTGRPYKVRVCVHAGYTLSDGSTNFRLYVNNTYMGQVAAGGSNPATFRSSWFDISSWDDFQNSNTYVTATVGSEGNTVWVWEVWLEVEYGPATSSTDTPGVAKTGTVTLTGSLVGEIFGSGKILADCTADSASPDGVCNYVLGQVGLPAVQTIGALTATLSHGLIHEYQTALWWLNCLAFQAGAWFMMPTGNPRLVSRLTTTPVKVIEACIASEDGRRTFTRTRTDLADVIDKIQVLYNRDWSQDKGDNAYAGMTAVGGAGSRERPELFKFDFITDSASANALRDLYLSRQAVRRWVAIADYWVDQADIESGDTVMLNFTGGGIGIVIPAEYAPGSMDLADTVRISILM